MLILTCFAERLALKYFCPYLSYNFDNGCVQLFLTVFKKNIVDFLSDSSCIYILTFRIGDAKQNKKGRAFKSVLFRKL